MTLLYFTYCQGFSEESDDVDYQPPPSKKQDKSFLSSPPDHSSTSSDCQLNRGTKHKAVGIEGHLDTDAKRKALRHEHFEQMARKFGYTSDYDFAVHVKEASEEERREMLDEFYEIRPLHQEEKNKTFKVNSRRTLPKTSKLISKKRGSRRSALEFEDSPFEKMTCKSPEAAALTCTPTDTGNSFSDSITEARTDPDYNSPHESYQPTTSLFDYSNSRNYAELPSHQRVNQSCVADSLVDELFEVTQQRANQTLNLTLKQHGDHTPDIVAVQKQTEPSPKPPLDSCAESSINIDELFG